MEDLKKEKVKSKFKIKKLLLVLAIAIFIVAMTIIIIIGLNKKYKNVNMCIMEYNVNGGTQINSLDMECGSKVSEPITPTKDGFEFVGWYI